MKHNMDVRHMDVGAGVYAIADFYPLEILVQIHT